MQLVTLSAPGCGCKTHLCKGCHLEQDQGLAKQARCKHGHPFINIYQGFTWKPRRCSSCDDEERLCRYCGHPLE